MIFLATELKSVPVNIDKVEEYSLKGWVFGHLNKTCHGIRITNGIEGKIVDPNEIEIYFKNGWKKGSLIKGNHWYTNGTENILSRSCPPGFRLGRSIDNLRDENGYWKSKS